MTHIEITLSRGTVLRWRLAGTPVSDAWIERYQAAQRYPRDQPDRFYGFDDPAKEQRRAETMVRNCINIINFFEPIIQRPFEGIHDQDGLNYLHSIFEQYHGLLDQQQGGFWQRAPLTVRQALAQLNIAVHRCETVSRGEPPRLVCTWFGLPKDREMDPGFMTQWGRLWVPWGTLCFNYAEIGKTLEHLAQDQDTYISDDAFQPFRHYSADFVVYFSEHTVADARDRADSLARYWRQHQEWFSARGHDRWDHIALRPLRYPVAYLDMPHPREEILHMIQQDQNIIEITTR
jgi:hypothetical protein